jgi:hypothetical protein
MWPILMSVNLVLLHRTSYAGSEDVCIDLRSS